VTERPRRLLAVLVLVSVTLLALDSREPRPSAPLRTAVDAVLGPVDAAVGGAASSLGGLADGGDVRRLRAENARLREELARARAAQRAGAALADLLAAVPVAAVRARVVGAGSGLGERTLEVDVGTRDGVDEGLPVVAAGGLVGRTVRTGPRTSTVLLLDDASSGVGARLTSTGALGLLRGDGAGRLEWVQVDPGPVELGDELVTSGSGTYPPGLALGRVVEVGSGSGGLTTTAVVEPAVAPLRLEVVAVLLPGERGPRPAAAPP
jgi:rod shape-determining protein MreC